MEAPSERRPTAEPRHAKGALQEDDMRISFSRLSTFVALGGALTLVACGGSSEISPAAPAPPVISQSDDGGTLSSDGYGPGTGTGTCTNDCNGTGQGPADGTGNGYGPGPGPMNGFCGSACVGPVGPDPADVREMLERALQEEYRAQYLYESVLEDYPGAAPFALIVQAEDRHVEAVQTLFARRQLAPPASSFTPAAFPSYDSLALSCAAGASAEAADASFYTPYLTRTDLPQDVRNVFKNLQAASLYNHLPAFERCR
jgi:hypothetical protein